MDLRIVPLNSPADALFPLSHAYIEIVYLPEIGPAAVIVARHLERQIAVNGGPFTIDRGVLAREVGLRASASRPDGRSTGLHRVLDRLERARIIRHLGTDRIGVEQALPPLSPKALDRLPASARAAHDHFLAGRSKPESHRGGSERE